MLYLLTKQRWWLWTGLRCSLCLSLGAAAFQSSSLMRHGRCECLSQKCWLVIPFNHVVNAATQVKCFSQGSWARAARKGNPASCHLASAGACLPACREEGVFVGSSCRWHFLHTSDLFVLELCAGIYYLNVYLREVNIYLSDCSLLYYI